VVQNSGAFATADRAFSPAVGRASRAGSPRAARPVRADDAGWLERPAPVLEPGPDQLLSDPTGRLPERAGALPCGVLGNGDPPLLTGLAVGVGGCRR
jgi:hypothetical protein